MDLFFAHVQIRSEKYTTQDRQEARRRGPPDRIGVRISIATTRSRHPISVHASPKINFCLSSVLTRITSSKYSTTLFYL